MMERWWSRVRQEEMLNNPDDILTVVSDGADQKHHRLPYLFKKEWLAWRLQQHLQLIYQKGKKVFCCRSYPNLLGDANRAIECAFRALKYISNDTSNNKKEGLPPMLYFDCDGGSENACKATIGFFGMLVQKDIVQRVVISRLPVGHTHRDVDAKIATGNVGLRSGNHNRVSKSLLNIQISPFTYN